MDSTPLLSICIPTYNQPLAAERLLREVFKQLTEDVEVIIRDDSTNLDTQEIVERFQEKKSIQYFRGKKEGLDAAILFLTKKARGKYVWWLGDDVIIPGAVAKVLNIARKYPDTSFLYVNSRQRGRNKATFSEKGSRFFKDGNQVIEEIVGMLGFISTTIFERKRALTCLNLAEQYMGSAWVNLYIVLWVLSQEGKKYFIGEPLIVSEPRDPSEPAWYDGFTVFAITFHHIVTAFRGRFAHCSMRRMLSHNLNSIWKGIFVYRAKGYTHGLGSHDPKIRPLFKLYWSYAQFWIALPFLLLPRSVARILYSIYVFIKKS